MDELEVLLARRKEIDAKIKALKEQGKTFGDAKTFIRRYKGSRANEHCVAIKLITEHVKLERWQSIVTEKDHAHMIGRLRYVVDCLQKLLRALEDEE